MQNNKQGFTLIELLVVVLIIGILSAIALPQYQKAVKKTKIAEAKTLLNALQKACQIAYLETGQHPQSDALSIEIPESKNWHVYIDECCVGHGTFGCSVEADPKANSGLTEIDIRLVDENYNLACGDTTTQNHTHYGFICNGNYDDCKAVGFTHKVLWNGEELNDSFKEF